MQNEYLQRFYARLQARYSLDNEAMRIGDWLCENTSLRGKPFSFTRYPFQEQITNDLHPALVCEKISQVGVSELMGRKALAVARRKSQQGVNVMFTLPNDDLFEKMSGTRIKTIIENDAVFNLEEDNKAIRNKNVYQFGHSFLYMVGATESDATSTSVDFMFNDEVDLTKQNMLALFASRLQNSDFKVRQQFSTPTFTGYGINALMALSDYHEYMVRCGCGHWQVPTFSRAFVEIPGLPIAVEDLLEIERNHTPLIDLDGSFVKCERCGRALDLDDYENREWVAKHENMPYRGYKVRPFSTHRLDIRYIVTQLLEYKARNFLRGFKNTVLGEADDGGSARIALDDILACMENPTKPETGKLAKHWYGCDVGQICTITIGVGENAENADVVEVLFCHVDDLEKTTERLLKTYNIIGGAIDRHPYEPTAEAIWRLSQGRIWPTEYRGSKEINPVVDVKQTGSEVEKTITHFQVNRTSHLDRVQLRISHRNISIRGYNQDHKALLADHLRNMVRKEEPEKEATWEKLDEADHFFHSIAFMLTSTMLPAIASMVQKVEMRAAVGFVAVEGDVKTPNLPGYSPHHSNSLRYVQTTVYG